MKLRLFSPKKSKQSHSTKDSKGKYSSYKSFHSDSTDQNYSQHECQPLCKEDCEDDDLTATAQNLSFSNDERNKIAIQHQRKESHWSRVKAALSSDPSLLTAEIFCLALQSRAPLEIVQFMLSLNPGIILTSAPSSGSLTPLQIAVKHKVSCEVLEEIIRACPQALCMTSAASNGSYDPLTYAKVFRPYDLDVIEILERPLSYWVSVKDEDDIAYAMKKDGPKEVLRTPQSRQKEQSSFHKTQTTPSIHVPSPHPDKDKEQNRMKSNLETNLRFHANSAITPLKEMDNESESDDDDQTSNTFSSPNTPYVYSTPSSKTKIGNRETPREFPSTASAEKANVRSHYSPALIDQQEVSRTNKETGLTELDKEEINNIKVMTRDILKLQRKQHGENLALKQSLTSLQSQLLSTQSPQKSSEKKKWRSRKQNQTSQPLKLQPMQILNEKQRKEMEKRRLKTQLMIMDMYHKRNEKEMFKNMKDLMNIFMEKLESNQQDLKLSLEQGQQECQERLRLEFLDFQRRMEEKSECNVERILNLLTSGQKQPQNKPKSSEPETKRYDDEFTLVPFHTCAQFSFPSPLDPTVEKEEKDTSSLLKYCNDDMQSTSSLSSFSNWEEESGTMRNVSDENKYCHNEATLKESVLNYTTRVRMNLGKRKIGLKRRKSFSSCTSCTGVSSYSSSNNHPVVQREECAEV